FGDRNRSGTHGWPHFSPRAGAVIPLAEDHLPSRRLQNRRNGDVYSFADHLACIVDHYHRAVVEIRDSLVVLFAFLQDEDPHALAGQHDRFERIGQFVYVQDFDALQLGNLVEVEIVGDDLPLIELGQFNQLEVHFADGGKVVFDDLHLQGRYFLQALQDVQTAAAAIPLERVGGVSHQLQLPQHKLRDHQRAVEKARLGNIGDAAVNDHAGIENLITPFELLFAAEDAAQSRQVEQVSFVGAHDQPDISHQQHDDDLEKAAQGAFREAVTNDQSEQVGADYSQDASDRRANQAFEADAAQPPLEDDNGNAQGRSRQSVNPRIRGKRAKEKTGKSNKENKENTDKNDIHSSASPEGPPDVAAFCAGLRQPEFHRRLYAG